MNPTRMPRRAAVYTLGCRLNQTETALICDDLARHGYELVHWGEPAELLVINGCTVTAESAAKTRKAAHSARRRCPEAFIAVVGCAPEMDPAAWSADGSVDLVVGNVAKDRLSAVLPEDLRRPPAPAVQVGCGPRRGEPVGAFVEEGAGLYYEKTRANLKVQEGCDFFCSYCIVPHVRGPARSRGWDDALREAAELLRRGHREIVLTGVNIATYADGGRDLVDLIAAILALGQGFRVRLGSTEPGPVLQRLVALMAREPRMCRFLHLPLQYGEDSILAAMNRRYRVADFAELAGHAAAALPGLCLGSDVIVGFPGETEATFQACCEAVRRLPINHLHVFTFSARRGTPAAALPNRVPGDLARCRAAELSRLGRDKAAAFAHSQVGRCLEVLTEAVSTAGLWEGWSDNYLRVTIGADAGLEANRLVPVWIDRVDPDGGTLLGHRAAPAASARSGRGRAMV